MAQVIYEYPYYEYDGLGSWTLRRRITKDVGVTPLGVSSFPDQNKLVVTFDAELTTEQKTNLDTLMAEGAAAFDPPNPTGVSIFSLEDIYEDFESVRTASNDPGAEIWFRESTPGSGNYDKIEIQFSKSLSVQERKAVGNYYANNAAWTVV